MSTHSTTQDVFLEEDFGVSLSSDEKAYHRKEAEYWMTCLAKELQEVSFSWERITYHLKHLD